MNAKKIQSFLNSMDKSCEGYSDQALSQRKKLQDVDSEFRKLDFNVKNTLNVVRKDNVKNRSLGTQVQSTARPRTAATTATTASASKRRPKTAQEKVPTMVVRPAPYPVKNYILPAQELVGPKRYYRSRAAQKLREENEEINNEFDRYPNSFEISPIKEQPNMIITPSQTFSKPVEDNWSTFGKESYRSDLDGY